jgi:hypothetical protein
MLQAGMSQVRDKCVSIYLNLPAALIIRYIRNCPLYLHAVTFILQPRTQNYVVANDVFKKVKELATNSKNKDIRNLYRVKENL